MKNLFIVLLILFTTNLFSQNRYSEDAKKARDKTNKMLSIEEPIDNDCIIELFVIIKDYLEQRDSIMIHEIPENMDQFCIVKFKCENPLHYKKIIEPPIFEKFIAYILRE